MSGISFITYLILTFAVAYAFILPSWGDVSALMAEKEKYESTIETVSNIENKKNELLTQFNGISEEDKGSINTVLPTSFDFVRLISQIDAVASRNGISIDKVSSKETSSSGGNSIQEAKPANPYRSAVISFSFEATYDKFLIFVNDLEKSMRILDIKSVKLETGKGAFHTYNVSFETYWLE